MSKSVRTILFSVIAVSMLLTACSTSGSASNGGSSVVVGTPVPVTGGNGGMLTINGAGATFPFPLYSRWFYDYAAIDKSVQFNYQSIGSGGGIKQITSKTVDFGASDAILSGEQLAAAPGLQMFPTVAGAEAIVANINDANGNAIKTPLKFPAGSLADIYLGKIKKWNDPVLATANPDIKLPNQDIIVVHRSDGSGTTFIFTDYLSKVSPDWKSKVGNATSVQWPVGLGGKGNEGVYGTVSQNPGAIGYVELAYALQNKAVINLVQNKAGQFVAPDAASTQSAMTDYGSDLGSKLALSITDGPGTGSYPITGYTYLLLYMDQQDCAKGQKLVAFLKWAYGDTATKDAAALAYVPLPEAVKKQVEAKIGQITCQGKPLGQ